MGRSLVITAVVAIVCCSSLAAQQQAIESTSILRQPPARKVPTQERRTDTQNEQTQSEFVQSEYEQMIADVRARGLVDPIREAAEQQRHQMPRRSAVADIRYGVPALTQPKAAKPVMGQTLTGVAATRVALDQSQVVAATPSSTQVISSNQVTAMPMAMAR